MAHRQQALIDKLLAEDQQEQDHSLQRKALARAMGKRVPRTLTPWEWEQYYAEHGIPESHSQARPGSEPGAADIPWWKRWFGAR